MTITLTELASRLQKEKVVTEPGGARYYASALGPVACVRYQGQGIVYEPQGRLITPPQKQEILLRPTSVSLCGTDLALIEKAKQGQLPVETQGKVVGHEAAGFIVGLGADVTEWQLGQYVCLDSHYGCGLRGHHHFNDCVNSGLSCDGIAGGIRGTLTEDEQRTDPYHGYWSEVLAIPASALPIELPLEIAQDLKAPSTLESLGNLYMIIGQLKRLGLTETPAQTLLIVSGLGATGYPMAAVAKHYGFTVVGVNPSPSKRDFALAQGAVDHAYANLAEVAPQTSGYEHVVIVVTADQPEAHEAALEFLATKLAPTQRKVAILFGLYADPKQPLVGAPSPYTNMPQRDFVFSRHHFTLASGLEVYGVCGRDLEAWQGLMQDLKPNQGEAPALTKMLNAAQLQVTGQPKLKALATLLNQGAATVEAELRAAGALKLVANLLQD